MGIKKIFLFIGLFLAVLILAGGILFAPGRHSETPVLRLLWNEQGTIRSQPDAHRL